MNYARKKIVFDTSALIATCLHPNREPAQIFRRALVEHDVYASEATLNELTAVLARNKFNAWQSLEHRFRWVGMYREAVILLEPTTTVTECRDPKDNKFLELALSARADCIVSSDVHLLEMHPFRGVQILQISEFRLQILGDG